MSTLPQGRWTRLLAFALSAALLSPSLCAQSTFVSPEDEYRKAIKITEDIQPLGENPFGESVSLYNGNLAFHQTDASLTGTGPVLSFARAYEVQGSDYLYTTIPDRTFGDWEIDLPRIETTTANAGSLTSWQTSGTSETTAIRNQRCTRFVAPPPVTFVGDNPRNDWTAYEWWSGYHLIVPGQPDQELMPRDAQNGLTPTMAGRTFPIVTTKMWQVGCLGATSSGEPGEAFFAVAPDGTKYTFDYLTYRAETSVEKALDSGVGPGSFAAKAILPHPNAGVDNLLNRRKAWMLVTRIEDRFGNALVYSYIGRNLTSIQSTSDNRKLTVQYDPTGTRVTSVTLQPDSGTPRTWTYQYGGPDSYRPQLYSVVMPDGHAWNYRLGGLQGAHLDYSASAAGSCYRTSVPSNLTATFTGTIEHPSGLTGTFTVQPMAHGRSGVTRQCWGVVLSPDADGYAITPSLWYSLTATSKTFSGAGVPPRTWTYQYSGPNNSWSADCPSSSSCASTVTTDVIDPEAKTVRYTFSNRYDYSESLLLRKDAFEGAAGSALLQSDAFGYADPTLPAGTWPWPKDIGVNLQFGRVNDSQITQLAPQTSRVTTMYYGASSDTYLWNAETFNEYAQVTQTRKSNSIGGMQDKVESASYLNVTDSWVLGLPTQISRLNPLEIVDAYTYDTATALLTSRAHFNKTEMTYTWDSAGRLASFSDALGHTTSLGDYNLGVPQLVTYADATQQHMAVSAFGQVVSVTNQAGNTTGYGYDAVGRLQSVVYPTGDSVAWAPRTLEYLYENVPSHGIDAGHWLRRETQNNRTKSTWFDATMRPRVTVASAADGSLAVSSSLAYDSKGNEVFKSYPMAGDLGLGDLADGTTTSYDALSRVTSTARSSELGHALVSTTSYLNGARLQLTDPNGNVSTASYQVFERPAYDDVLQVASPEGIVQSVDRNRYGDPTSITQGPVVKTLAYDEFHRLCRTTEPESASEVTAYDAEDNIVWSASGQVVTEAGCGSANVPTGAKTTREYDAMNRVVKVVYPTDGKISQTTYSATGKPLDETSGTVKWSYAYNKLDLITREELSVDGYRWSIGHDYDASGAASSTTYPDNKVIAYGPDALGRATAAGSYATGATYHPTGELSGFVLGSGVAYSSLRNPRQLVADFGYGVGGTIAVGESLVYDANANITQLALQSPTGARTKTYNYDGLNRLTRAEDLGVWGTESYTYDGLNNLQTLTADGGVTTYSYNQLNQLASVSSPGGAVSQFSYDSRGNMNVRRGTTLVFDDANRLTSIAGTGSYVYDAQGRRVKKTSSSGAVTYSAYANDGTLLWQFDPVTNNGIDFVYLSGKLVAQTTNLAVPAFAPSISPPSSAQVNVSYSLSWTSIAGATSYTLQEQSDGVAFHDVSSGAPRNASLVKSTAGVYGYRVAACNASGCGPWSVTTNLNILPAPTAPAQPGTIGAVLAADLSNITVSWLATGNTTSYQAQSKVNGAGWVDAYAGPAVTFALNMPADGSYVFQVRSCNAAGCSLWTGPTSPVVVARLPTAPGSISVPATSNGPIPVTWSASVYQTYYALDVSFNGGAFTNAYAGGATSATYAAPASGTYTFKARGCNANGCGTYGPAATSVVTLAPTQAPSISGPGSSTNGCYTINWGGIPAATSYVMQEQSNGGSWVTIGNNGSGSLGICGKTTGTYGYRVQGCNAGGCGPWSGTATVAVTLAPTTPTGITHVVTGGTFNPVIHLSWAAVSGATWYEVEETLPMHVPDTMWSGADTSMSQLMQVSGTVTFRIRACNAVGCSAYSAYVQNEFHSG
jgi:YD repeat-containing protein